jgi:hypothetical protein
MRTTSALALLSLLLAPPLAAQSHLLVVSGLAGEPRLEEQFHSWSTAMVDAGRDRFGIGADRITYLADKPERDGTRIDGEATKANIDAALARMAASAGPADRVLILLIGHGSSDGQSSRINLPGPDLTAAELDGMLDRFTTQRVVVVNTTSASGAFQEPLAGKNRTIITSTNSGREQNETVFARYFVDAFVSGGADVDKDGKVTVLEAYEFADTEVERFYESDNRLQTEHSVLGGDRELARAFTLDGGARTAAAGAGSASPEIRALVERRQALEAQVAALTARKDGMEAAAYQRELERLLLELARTNREIREKEGTE